MSRRHFFSSQLELQRPLEEVFAFFAQPENLARLTPKALRFRMLEPVPRELRVGARIEIEIRPFLIPIRWSARILEWNPPHHFLDDQPRGPYAEWTHRHLFERTESGTLIRDEVFYRLPLWPLGELAQPLVRAQIQRIFDYRKEAILRML